MPNVTRFEVGRKTDYLRKPDFCEPPLGASLPAEIHRSAELDEGVRLPRRMYRQRPPGSALIVAEYLDAECDRRAERHETRIYGVEHSLRRIADESGVDISTVRKTALPWLVAHDWIAAEKVEDRDGRAVTMHWCKWRFPDHLETGVTPVPTEPGARWSARRTVEGARFSARPDPKCTKRNVASRPRGVEFNSIQKTTTDTGMLSFVQVEDHDEGSTDGEPLAIPSQSPADIPEPVARAIESVEVAEDRPALRAFAPVLLAQHPVELVILVILAFRQSRLKGTTISDLPAWSAGVIRNRPGGPLVKAEVKRLADQAAQAKRAEADRQAARAKFEAAKQLAERQAIEATWASRWEALPAAERAAIETAVIAENPSLGARHMAACRRAACITRIEKMEESR